MRISEELSAHAISAPDHMYVQGHQFLNEEFNKMQEGNPVPITVFPQSLKGRGLRGISVYPQLTIL